MGIYKNKYRVEKEIYGCFQKEILFSRNQVVKAVVVVPKEVVPAVELPKVPLV
ncbi:MAG TPA: hypothetical protein VEC36_03685 [Patescibacteria group bacterium]|nr:hypothetical protein [Patescibacteria group bacterium]